MNINEEYALEMLLSGHLRGKEIGDGYIVAFMSECQITNPERLDRWLLHNGYLREPTIEETLSRYKVPELKKRSFAKRDESYWKESRIDRKACISSIGK